jgi:hypothetical protein
MFHHAVWNLSVIKRVYVWSGQTPVHKLFKKSQSFRRSPVNYGVPLMCHRPAP